MSFLRLMLQTPIADRHISRDKALDREDGSQLLVHDVATDTSAETRKLEGKLDALVNLVTQLAANQKPSSVARVATDTSAETRNLKGKLDALVNLVTQLTANKKPTSVARVFGIHPSNDHHTSVCSSSQQSGFSARNDAIVIRKVHDVATDTSAETRKLEGKLDALVNLVSKLAANQKSASVARVCGIRSSNDHHTSVCSSSQQSGVDEHPEAYATNTYNTSAETRKLESKLDTLMNLVTQLAANQKPASIARVFGIHSSNDHHTSVCLYSQQSGVDEHPKAYVGNTFHHVATDTSAETRKLEGKLDALAKLVTKLAASQRHAFVARVCGIRSSNDHHTSRQALDKEDGSQLHAVQFKKRCHSDHHNNRDKALDREDGSQLKARARNDAIVIRGVHDVATDTSAETRKLEGKLDSLVNFVTQLATNQKPASVAKVCGIRSSNDHHTSVSASSQQSGVDENPEAYAANTYSRPPKQ
ncbi:hypothetical protein Fmac_028533 [Flemingia macrophylla]|uniref:Uncharacterized protein n=1 Tax=Flemingia macrophylla TaxID=520843 RepID=A0ABD1L7S2_9FABA